MDQVYPKVYPIVSNEEKNEINLRNHIKMIHDKLGIVQNNSIIMEIMQLLGKVTKIHGNKRGKPRDAIILVIISKNTPIILNESCERMGIDKKYIYKANDILLDINYNTIDTPYSYIKRLYTDDLESDVLEKTRNLITDCIQEDKLSNISNKALGVTCLYKILLDYGYHIDVYEFGKKFHVSDKIIVNNYMKF